MYTWSEITQVKYKGGGAHYGYLWRKHCNYGCLGYMSYPRDKVNTLYGYNTIEMEDHMIQQVCGAPDYHLEGERA